MVKKGFLLSIISILIIVLMVYYFLPIVWEIDKYIFLKEFLD